VDVRDAEKRVVPPIVFEVDLSPMDVERFRSVLSPERYEEFERAAEEGRHLLEGRVVWNINSTAKGGGVVELLRSLVPYARGAGVDARWAVIEAPPEFFAVTKRIHNRLHGAEGDGGPLDDTARRIYEQVAADNVAEFIDRVHAGDVAIVHDPQPAGMIKALLAAGANVIWRCHVGVETPNDLSHEAWAFLMPYIRDAEAYVFSREAFAFEGLDRSRVVVIPPTIDVFAPKNVDLDPATVQAVLRMIGMIADGPEPSEVPFQRLDGTPGRVERRARLVEDEQLRSDVPVVLQVSRWDALKDPLGVIRGFAEHVPADTGAHLVYAGPDVEAVADDPEGLAMLRESIALRDSLPEEARRRVHLASMPMEDPDENAIMINALQRHARVIAQKSLAEGFGLTVAEAMWKGRPVVASRIGGIQDQIVHGESGLLLDDPHDLAAFGAAITGLLQDERTAEQMGHRGRERVREHFISVRSLLDYLGVIQKVAAPALAPH
jgi:trehalose synthase